MRDKINSIDISGELDHDKMYNLFRTHSSKANKEIFEKINIYKNTIDFFEFYSNKDIKTLLNIFNLKVSDDEFFSPFKSDIKLYISTISQIILAIKLLFKSQEILTKIIINSKSILSKLKTKNNLENYYQDHLFIYLESLFNIPVKNPKFRTSTSTYFSSFDGYQKNLLFPKFYNGYTFDYFSNNGIESTLNDTPSTPRFELELNKEFENQEKKNSDLENHTIKKSSGLTFSNYVFAEESLTQKNTESTVAKPKIKNSYTKERKIENANIHKEKRNKSSEIEPVIKNNKKNYYKNLLEMINKIYKNGFINSSEKLKLKEMLISKSKKIEYFYYNIYKNSKKDKEMLVTEVKKIIN